MNNLREIGKSIEKPFTMKGRKIPIAVGMHLEKFLGMEMNHMNKMTLFALIGLALLTLPVQAQINLLHEFAGGVDDGLFPKKSLIISGSTLYGTTAEGGDSDFGTIFKIQTDGSGYIILHEFAGGTYDGQNPSEDLVISGSTLYGMTNTGGYNNCGTIFKIETDGTGYSILYSFSDSATDGKWPQGSLILSGSILYGMTYAGGEYDRGVIFKIETGGTGFSLLHSFNVINDGSNPNGSLIISGTTLFGMTPYGGYYNNGIIFKIETTASAYVVLHEFSGGPYDGQWTSGSLTISGSTLYGMTRFGGSNYEGTVFKINTDSSGYELLYEFAGFDGDGMDPNGSLIISGSTLFGMNTNGGSNSFGTIFMIDTNGGGYALLHEFAGGAEDGVSPYGSLILSGSTFYGMTSEGGENNKGVIFSLPIPSLTVISPNGGENWNSGTSHNVTWTSLGSVGNVNIDYSSDDGNNWISVAVNIVNSGTYTWTVPAVISPNCLVRIQETADSNSSDISNRVFSISSASVETISTPRRPAGVASGLKDTVYSFCSGSANSNFGHSVQYKLDWNDGTDSGWLAEGTTSASHSWAANGTYHISAMARCVTHTVIESLWSTTYDVTISDGTSTGYYNSPANLQILPEVIWAPATGGGTWVSDVQLIDVSGGSQVQVYYNCAAGRRGPFTLWNNDAGGAMSTTEYANLLETIDGLDGDVFTYYGTVGAVEFSTQDAGHLIHVAVREMNGNYAKTFPGLNPVNEETANVGRNMIIPNLANNATYRTTCGFYNPTADPVTLDLKLINDSGTQAGSTISKTLAGHGFMAFNPFAEAGVPYPGSSYDNIALKVEPTSGSGSVMCFGATANNTSNDPAAHIAVQESVYDNGSSSYMILPEVIWAPASGSGTWLSDVQIVDVSGGSQVQIYYNTTSGRRGPFLLWNNGGGSAMSSTKYANLLQTIDALDSGSFTYYGTVGAVEFATQDGGHLIHVAVRELNGDYAKTFPGLNLVNANTASVGRNMIVPNLANNAMYRATCGLYNPTADAVMLDLKLITASGTQAGSTVSKTLPGYGFMAFNPFAEAGVPYPGSSYDNILLKVVPTSGSGRVLCFGATANNISNDPAAHIAVQGQ